jgi:hypothetical protein
MLTEMSYSLRWIFWKLNELCKIAADSSLDDEALRNAADAVLTTEDPESDSSGGSNDNWNGSGTNSDDDDDDNALVGRKRSKKQRGRGRKKPKV